MMQLKTFVVLASIAATLASNNCEIADVHDDHVALLQGQVEEQRGRKADTVDDEPPEDYQLKQTLKCAGEQGAAASEAFDITLATEQEGPASAGTVREWIAANTIKKDVVDPPGASELRVVLQLMFCLLILDGMWRFWKKSQDNSCSQMVDVDEATMKSSRVELVNVANSGNERCFKKLHGAPPATSTHADAWGCTPLHFAAAGGSPHITAELLQQGVEIDALDAHDETPLHFAARAGHVSTCEVLVNGGAKIDAVNGNGLTPLVVAGMANQQSTCRFLVDQGAGVAGLTDEELPPLVVSQIVLKMFAA